MLAVRTPGAPQATRTGAACDSAFPFERQGRLLRSRSISGLFSRSLYSGLHPPCLRFAVAVTGHHARLGSRLLARLYRGRHLRRQTSTRFSRRNSHTTVRTGPYTAVREVTLTHVDQARETERFEVGIGEPDRESFTPGEMPGATATGGRIAQLPRDSQRDECRSAPPWCFPLTP